MIRTGGGLSLFPGFHGTFRSQQVESMRIRPARRLELREDRSFVSSRASYALSNLYQAPVCGGID